MKKSILLIGILSIFLFASNLHAVCINHDERCNYPNCTQYGVHYHHNLVTNAQTEQSNEQTNETPYFHCEVEGCLNTTPHTHETTPQNTNCPNYNQRHNSNNNYYGHHSNGHHGRHH